MTNASLTDLTIVLDRSGSMAAVREATIEAFNGYVRSQQTGSGTVQLSLVQFDDQYEPVLTCQPIDRVKDLTNATYQPRGSTALLDAVGRTIVETGRRLKSLPAAQRPGKVLFVIQTDGFENASREYQAKQINAMIAEQRDRYAWQFVFLGANQDAITSAAQFGIAAGASLSYGGTSRGTMAAFDVLGERTRAFREATIPPGKCPKWEFTEEQRGRAKGDT